MFFFIGIPCGLAHQECPVSWTVLFLPHQVVLHLQYSHHSPICSSFQSLCYLTDVVCEICRKLFRQSIGSLVRCRGWPCLPHRRVVLLPVAAGNAWTRFGRSAMRRDTSSTTPKDHDRRSSTNGTGSARSFVHGLTV